MEVTLAIAMALESVLAIDNQNGNGYGIANNSRNGIVNSNCIDKSNHRKSVTGHTNTQT